MEHYQNISLLLTIIGMMIIMAFNTWAIIRYLLDRMDEKMQSERDERLKTEADISTRLDKIKETHVLREDFHRFVDDVKGQITQMTNGINHRMDSLFTALTTIKIGSTTNNNIVPPPSKEQS